MKASARSNVFIIGAGRHGKEVACYLRDLESVVSIAGFVDECKKGNHAGLKILGGFKELEAYLRKNRSKTFRFITAAGENALRRSIVDKITRLGAANLNAWSLIHPRSWVGTRVEIGEGTCLAPGSLVTTDARIGRHCILNIKASVSHDCDIGDYVNLNPSATICGDVRIGEGSYIGAGATVIDKITIGKNVVVGAGAVVIDDLPDGVTAVGVPARVLKTRSSAY